MNRRDFHRTLIAGAGMAAMPAWANLLPTPEDMLCGHELRPGVRCERERGHEWEHRKYEPWVLEAFPERIDALKVPEWNDDRVVWKRMEAGRMIRVRPDWDGESLQAHARTLIRDARHHLAPGAVFELRSQPLPVNPLTVHDWGIAWYWQPAPHQIPRGFNPAGRTMVQSGFFRVPPLEGFPRSGYNVFARLIA